MSHLTFKADYPLFFGAWMPAALPADRQLDDGKGTGVGEAGGKHWGCRWGEVDGRQLSTEAGVDPGDSIVIRKKPKEGPSLDFHGSELT